MSKWRGRIKTHWVWMWNRVRVRSSRTAAQYWAAGFQAGRGRIVERGRTTAGHMARRYSSHEIPCALIFHHFSAYLSRLTSLLLFFLLLDARRDLCRDRYMLFNFIFCFLFFSFSFADVVCEKKLTFGVTLIFLAFYIAIFFSSSSCERGWTEKIARQSCFSFIPRCAGAAPRTVDRQKTSFAELMRSDI